MVVLNRSEDLGVAVCRLDETLTLALEDLLSASGGRVDQGSDLETGTELVLETERVAGVSPTRSDDGMHSLPRSLIRTEHDVLSCQ